MAGAVQVLALSDDENNLSCSWNTPRSQVRPRSRPEIRQCTSITPGTGDVVCLDSDEEPEIQGKRNPDISAKVYQPQQLPVQLDVQETPSLKLDELDGTQAKGQCTPVVTMKTPHLQQAAEVDDCCIIVQEKPSSNSKVDGGRPIFSILDDCCILKETPSSSKVDRKLKSPSMDFCSIVKERPSSSSRPSARVFDFDSQRTTVMSETGIQMPDFARRPVEIFSIKDIMKQIPTADWTPGPFAESYMPPEVPEEIERPAKRQKKTQVASLAGTICDMETNLETRREGEEEPCGDGIQRNGSRGQKISEEERQRSLREKELEFERKQAEQAEKKREKDEAKKKRQEDTQKKKEEEKARKLAAKKAAQEQRKAENEVSRFKRKAALEHMVASVDIKVAEKGLIGGQLLSRFVQKKLHYTLVSNPIDNSITWRTKRLRLENQEIDQSQDIEVLGSQGEFISTQVVHEDVHIQYILFVFEAEEFSTMVAESSLTSHVREAQQRYPDYTICYLVNKLMLFLQTKDQAQYQSNHPASAGGWQRPSVEKALAGLTTNFTGVHSRLCVDEADVADHVSGLMQIFADALYRPKLTRLSVCKNGGHVWSGDPFKEEIGKSLWLKTLMAIPKVSGPCAIAIGRIYPSMRSLLRVYLDNTKPDREKELLLKDLKRESVFGSTAGQRIGAVCSRQIFHVLMSQNGNVKVDGIDEDPHED